MSLAEIFLSRLPDERRARVANVPDLGEALAVLVAKGRAAWPDLALTEADFMTFLARVLPDDAAETMAALRGDDLWLACAYGAGVVGAADALEGHALVSISRTLTRIGASPPLIADVLQELRRRLVEMQSPRANQKLYAGRGDLVGWLRVSAVRDANLRRNRHAREMEVGMDAGLYGSPAHDPEILLLLKTHKRELHEAFQRAFAAMSSRERNVLRYHFVEEMSIDMIGELYGVHRATAARWITRACELLSRQTRALFCERVSMSEEGFQRVVVLIQSEIRRQ